MKSSRHTNTGSSSPLSDGAGGGSYRYIEVHIDGPVARVNLNRPERHNALILELISELGQVLDEISGRDELNFLVLSGKGRSFCAGADINWFYSSEELSVEQSSEQYKQLADLMLKLFRLPQITIAAVRGNVFGGGIGLMAACDFVLAETNSRFMFSEVKLGLLPATILPFVAKRLSVQSLRKWILTGNLFIAAEAHDAGLVDILCGSNQLKSKITEFISSFSEASPTAFKKAKQLINQVTSGEVDITNAHVTSGILAEALHSTDGQEGIKAFLEKRKPKWKQAPLSLPKGETLGRENSGSLSI
ncbi:MAG: enoyl-CoA hydratase-related protein [Prolixibacteraceae bacterium]|jgi:methylglutaconyl-CoA hydratase